MRFLLLLFIVVPILEMVLLIKVGGVIGALPTVALVCLTAMIGLALIRAQGFSTLQRAQWRVNHGEMPGQEIVDGMCLAVGGALLLTPGFATDALGFLLLVPGLRKHLFSKVLNKMSFSIHSAAMYSGTRGSGSQDHVSRSTESNTVEGEYWRDK